MVKVGKGPSAKTFNVHAELLSAFSPYFAALLSSPCIESQQQLVHLDDDVDTVPAFEGITTYLYSRRLSFSPTDESLKKQPLLWLTGVFLMGGKLCMDMLQRVVLRQLWVRLSTLKTLSKLEEVCAVVELVYKNTVDERDPFDDSSYGRMNRMDGFPEETAKRTMRPSSVLRKLLVCYCASIQHTVHRESPFWRLIPDTEHSGFWV